MQESELDNTGLADSQEWVDVPQDQETEVGVSHDEGISADQTVPDAQQPEVMDMTVFFSRRPFDGRSCRGRYQRLVTSIGPRMTKVDSHLSQGFRPNLEHPRRRPPRTRPKKFRIQVQQTRQHHPLMVTHHRTGTASHRPVGGVVDHAGIVASGVVVAESAAVFVEASAEVSEGNVAAQGEGREAVSDSPCYHMS